MKKKWYTIAIHIFFYGISSMTTMMWGRPDPLRSFISLIHSYAWRVCEMSTYKALKIIYNLIMGIVIAKCCAKKKERRKRCRNVVGWDRRNEHVWCSFDGTAWTLGLSLFLSHQRGFLNQQCYRLLTWIRILNVLVSFFLSRRVTHTQTSV